MQKYIMKDVVFKLIVFVSLFLFSCHNKSVDPKFNSQIDSLLTHAKDSLYHNNAYSKLQYKAALELAKDSDTYYKVLSDYISYYYANNSYDTAIAMNKKLFMYADRYPNSSGVCDFRTSANNFAGNYYTIQNKFDSAIYFYQIALKCFV